MTSLLLLPGLCLFCRMKTKHNSGEQTSYIGHFEILRPDGTVVPVNSEGQNCLYHAIAQANSKNPGDIKTEAKVLRNEVKNTVSFLKTIISLSICKLIGERQDKENQ